MKIKQVLTLKPFKTEKGTLVRSSAVNKLVNTKKWDVTKGDYVYHWLVSVINIETEAMQYWLFDYYGNRIKVLTETEESI